MSVLYVGDPSNFAVLVLRTNDEGVREPQRILSVPAQVSPYGSEWGRGFTAAYDLASALLVDQVGYEPPKPTVRKFADYLSELSDTQPFVFTGLDMDKWLSANWTVEEENKGESMWSDQLTPDEAGT